MTDTIAIKRLETLEEFRACQEVQRAAWQFPDLLIIPYTQLTSVQHNGGLVLGAFDGTEMVGFVFGYLGRGLLDGGDLYLFSQRMGVLPTHQGRGIGERLKWAQRAWALEQGLEHVVWTYDPLEPPNAYLNIAKLGGIVRRYERDFYGMHHTPLHDRLPSDRFVVDWQLRSPRVLARLRPGGPPPAAGLPDGAGPPLNAVAWDERGLPRCAPPDLERDAPLLTVEVPAHWQALRRADMELALDWRLHMRAVFEHYFARGYAVGGYVSRRFDGGRRNYYLLRRQDETR